MTALHIFVVDDDCDVADSLADVLELNGHRVTTAYGSQEAIDTFAREDFDLTFMDVMMPGLNGVESFIAIKKFKPDAKVVMMTGYSVQNLLDQAMREGAAGILHKPVAVEEVLSMLDGFQQDGESEALVLVSDAAEDASGQLEALLRERGLNVVIAHSGEQALSAVEQDGIDVLILDLDLPVISGLEVFYEMKRRGRVIPTVLVSGGRQPDQEAQHRLKDLAVSGIFFKPFDPAALLSSLERLVHPDA